MIRDCKDWRACKKRAREAVTYSAQRAIWTITGIYGSGYAERIDKNTLVDMVYELMQENGLETRRKDADLAVESWYQEGLV